MTTKYSTRNFDPVFDAWKKLSNEQIRKMEIDFQNIYKMGCAGGIKALIDEASWHYVHRTSWLYFPA